MLCSPTVTVPCASRSITIASGMVKTAAVSVPSMVRGPGATVATNGVTSKLLARRWLAIGNSARIVTRSGVTPTSSRSSRNAVRRRSPASAASTEPPGSAIWPGWSRRCADRSTKMIPCGGARRIATTTAAVRLPGCIPARSRRRAQHFSGNWLGRRDGRPGRTGRSLGLVIDFFLHRPVFASVCALFIILAGLVSIPTLPVAQFPQVAPPVVTVTTNFIGANAQAAEASVTTPLEEAINGVDGLRYITSTTTSDGTSSVVCTFQLDRNIDLAANDVQNQVNNTIGRLPAEVRATGVTVTKNSGTFVIAMGLTSSDARYDRVFVSNYAANNIVDVIKRIRGVNDVRIFGERRYAMRLWLDPTRLNLNHLTASDVVNALQTQNVQVAAGAIGSAPVRSDQPYQISIRTMRRLHE